MKVYKPSTLFHDNYYTTGGFNLGSKKENIPVGKVCISLPYKKGRRKLVKGYIVSCPYTIPGHDLDWDMIFVPYNTHQLDKMRKLRPDLFT